MSNSEFIKVAKSIPKDKLEKWAKDENPLIAKIFQEALKAWDM